MLLHANPSFDKLARATAKIETTVRASERMYKQVLARHSNSVKVLQLYVKFLQSVRNDPWSAAKWMAEAEKLQKLEEEANERCVRMISFYKCRAARSALILMQGCIRQQQRCDSVRWPYQA